MTLSQPNPVPETSVASSQAQTWYRPILSPEHGVYVMLFVSFLTGAAAAQQWTIATTLALIAAFAGFQAEHPLVLQIKQRRSWKPRFLVWGGVYSAIALTLSAYLALQTPVLLWVYLGAIATFAIDAIAVYYRKQKSISNELLTFAGVCLAAPFAYVVTTGTFTVSILGLWLLNTLFFSSAIFTVKLRKPKTSSLTPALVYHAIAPLLTAILWYLGWLNTPTSLAIGIILVKFAFILIWQDWYRTTRIQKIAVLETTSALLFLGIVGIALLPALLP
ncbi:MAG: YwiC-like family protein [Oculatellaceae cyanobacterium Prado106]|jgi:hypothetical protein|nr:YwiC-like family protein [Oculatellaceae cyanobacterium Prado106]